MKYFKILLTVVIMHVFVTASAQVNIGGKPMSWKEPGSALKKPLPAALQPSIPLQQLQEEDARVTNEAKPYRFGFKIKKQLDFFRVGVAESISGPSAGIITRYHIKCPGALSINLLYSKFWLAPGVTFYLYKPDKSQLAGGFTNANNTSATRETARSFGTELIYGEEVILEVFEPEAVAGQSIINISDIVHGYRSLNFPARHEHNNSTEASGSCQVNVNCSEGSNWQDEKRGIVRILVRGNGYCSGSLVNNTAQNGELYVLTANHCLQDLGTGAQIEDAVTDPDASDWTFYWNLERTNCTGTEENLMRSTTGATVIANLDSSDFALFRLTESPFMTSNPYGAYFNGWSRSVLAVTTNGVGIHHPAGDYKKIATHTAIPFSPQTATSIPGGNSNYYWQVKWAATTNGQSVTEGGSSGSPLFSSNSLIIGQLYGGSSINCSDPDNDPGVYGKFNISWNQGTSAPRRLKEWLDPGNTSNITTAGSYHPCPADYLLAFNINTQKFVQAANVSTSSTPLFYSVVQPAATLHVRASDKIIFSPGFECKGTMIANIAPCL